MHGTFSAVYNAIFVPLHATLPIVANQFADLHSLENLRESGNAAFTLARSAAFIEWCEILCPCGYNSHSFTFTEKTESVDMVTNKRMSRQNIIRLTTVEFTGGNQYARGDFIVQTNYLSHRDSNIFSQHYLSTL